MATIIRAPERLSAKQKKTATTLFLAGPFEDGDGEDPLPRSWRDEFIEAYADLDVRIYDARNPRWAGLEPDSAGQRGVYDWQCDTAFDADVVVVWVPDDRQAPTALMILGYLTAKRGNATKGSSVVVGGGGWGGLVKLFAQNGRLFRMEDDPDEVVQVGRIQLEEALAAERGK